MRKLKSRILGFDARETWQNPEKYWNKVRKEKFLFRLEVTMPLSIDPIVWRSVFDFHAELKPNYVGFHQDLWKNLENLKECVARSDDLNSKSFDIIAFSLVTDLCSDEDLLIWDSLLGGIYPNGTLGSPKQTSPENPTESWSLLGFDVADQFDTSALANCGFTEDTEDVLNMRNEWGKHLNDSHLFVDPAHAELFRIFSNHRIPQHAPFFVYKIWRIERRKGR